VGSTIAYPIKQVINEVLVILDHTADEVTAALCASTR
jgi:hypothetical protein